MALRPIGIAFLFIACVIGAPPAPQAAVGAPASGHAIGGDIPKPGEVPHDATGRCQDGSWSSADQKKGACSGHGGVQAWFGKPPKKATGRCQDGTFTKSAGQGACSGHGGVAYWLKKSAA